MFFLLLHFAIFMNLISVYSLLKSLMIFECIKKGILKMEMLLICVNKRFFLLSFFFLSTVMA